MLLIPNCGIDIDVAKCPKENPVVKRSSCHSENETSIDRGREIPGASERTINKNIDGQLSVNYKNKQLPHHPW